MQGLVHQLPFVGLPWLLLMPVLSVGDEFLLVVIEHPDRLVDTRDVSHD